MGRPATRPWDHRQPGRAPSGHRPPPVGVGYEDRGRRSST